MLVRLRVVTLAQLKSVRSYVIVGAFVIGAIFTPPDVISQLSLAIPMCVLYELGILAAQTFIKQTKASETEAEAESDAETGEVNA